MLPGKQSDRIVITIGQSGSKIEAPDIILLHDSAYPDIDRERFVFLERKEQDAVSGLGSHTMQFHHFFPGILIW